MQLGFYFDQTRCTGCEACVVACKDWKDIPAGSVALCRIASLEGGRFPNPSVSFYPLFCFHCAEPPCVDTCPAGAISKRPEDGVVVVAEDLCLPGCRLCHDACPYRAPQFAEDGPARLCDLCLDRRANGEKPICVVACPQYALDAGPLEELRMCHGGDAQVEGFPDPGKTKASILFRRKKAQAGSKRSEGELRESKRENRTRRFRSKGGFMRNRFFALDGQLFVILSANGSGSKGPQEQTELTMARLREDLAKVGSRFENILRIVVYMKSREIRDTVGKVRQQVFVPWETRPASASIFVEEFRHDDALVEIEATAMVRSEFISKRGVEYEPARAYLRALVSGPFVFLSGTGGEGRTEEAQAESCFGALGACLEGQGGSLRDLRRVAIFLKRLEAMGDASRVFQRLFKEPRPYVEFVPATGFARDEMLVEIQGTAMLR